uniref:Protein krueppel n=1 Tax=Clastoptera arizonana TaxID=38151 RepID=A0A1B6DF48_9HEMI
MENKGFSHWLSNVNLEEICRLCLSSKGIMCSIFDLKQGQLFDNLPERITEITTLKVEENDGLPSQICHSCLYNLEQLSEFRDNCLESDSLLREYLSSSSNIKRKRFWAQNSYPTNFRNDSDQLESHEGSNSIENSFEDSNFVGNSMTHHENGLCNNANEEERETETPHLQKPFSIDLWGLQEMEDNVENMVMVVDPSIQPMDDRCSDSDYENERELIWELGDEGLNCNFTCTTCNKGFYNEQQLGRHYLIHTQEAPFPCDFCEKEFEERNLLKRHWRTHAGSKPYICFTCGEAFMDRPQLTQHQDIHDCIKPFHCSTCGKAFAYKSDLRKHAVIHTGVRPYVCKVCGKSFTRSTNLNKHARVHSGRRPFACDHCKKMFASRGDLTRHIVIHTGEKPYACTICDLAFNRKDKLSRHEKLHAGDRAYSCIECPTSYHRKEELTKHIQFHHYKPDSDFLQ